MYKVLIADDEPYIIDGLKAIINWEKYGFTVVGAAETGEEALEMYERYKPDFVVFDICIPVYSGVELARMLRERGYKNEIALLTGYRETDYAREAIKYRVKYYFTKPIGVKEIETALGEIKRELDRKKLLSMEFWEDFVPDEVLYRGGADEGTADFAELMEYADDIVTHVKNRDLAGTERVIDGAAEYIGRQSGQESLIDIFCAYCETRFLSLLHESGNESPDLFGDIMIEPAGTPEAMKAPVTEMCVRTMSIVDKSEPAPDTNVDNVARYLKEHYKEDIIIKELALKFHINHVYLGVIFSKRMGMSIKKYIHMLRMQDVKRQLCEGDKSLKDIAFDVGYNNYNNFFNWFERFFGMTPEEYRKNLNNTETEVS